MDRGGARLTVADFSVAMTLPYAEESQLPLDEFTNMRRWHDRLNEIEPWREPSPVRQRKSART
jgi:glutathione S-transferase